MTNPPCNSKDQVTTAPASALQASLLYDTSSQATNTLIKLIEDITSRLTKKHRQQNDKDEPSSSSSSSAPSAAPSAVSEEETSEIEEERMEMDLTKATCQLLKLKQAQRSLGLMVGSALTSRVTEARREVEAQSLALQNVLYEKNHLQNEIRSCRELECKHLLQMAREEQVGSGGGNGGDLDKGVGGEGTSSVVTNDNDDDDDGDNENDNDNNDERNSNENDNDDDDRIQNDAVIDAFLAPPPQKTPRKKQNASTPTEAYSHKDPRHHSYNLSKMHSEITLRGTLANDLARATEEKETLLQNLRDKNKFLNGIPDKLAQVERSTLPLQDYFVQRKRKIHQKQITGNDKEEKKAKRGVGNKNGNGNGNTTVTSTLHLTGTERRARLEKASSLPAPLHTLFVQLQSYLDGAASNVDGDGHAVVVSVVPCASCNRAATNSSWLERDKSAVRLSLPLPRVLLPQGGDGTMTTVGAGAGDRVVKVQFEYLTKLRVVTAHVCGDETFSSPGTADTVDAASATSSEDKVIMDALLWNDSMGVSNMNRGGKTVESMSSSSSKRLLLLNYLFKGDHGMDLPNGSIAQAYFTNDDGKQEETDKDDFTAKEENEKDFNDEGDEQQEMMDVDFTEDAATTDITMPETIKSKQMELEDVQRIISEGGSVGKPYYWCQYMAGLHYPAPTTANTNDDIATHMEEDDNNHHHNLQNDSDRQRHPHRHHRIEPSTKAIIQQLHRRLRAHATLVAILNYFEKKKPNPIPIHPCMANIEGGSRPPALAKLVAWNQNNGKAFARTSTTVANDIDNSHDDDDDDEFIRCKYYTATIKRKSITLRAVVKIDVRYPAVPPVWCLQPSSLEEEGLVKATTVGSNAIVPFFNSSVSPPLFDSALGQIEAQVNSLEGFSSLIEDEKEETYDWILLHQLREIILCWDNLQQSLENGSDVIGHLGMIGRLKRGRDRRSVGSFGTYAKGL